MFNILDAAASTAATEGKTGGMDYTMIIMLVAMFAILYFFMIRPQQKKQKEIQKFRNSLTVGSTVLTASGVKGIVKNLNEGMPYITIEIAKGVNIEVDRNYVFADATQAQQK